MELKMFCVLDSKVKAYLPPMFFRETAEAIRSFSHACNTKDTDFNRWPEDYTLFEIGVFNDADASLVSLPTPHPLGKAVGFLNTPLSHADFVQPQVKAVN